MPDYQIHMGNVLDLLKQAVDTRGPDYKYRDTHTTCSYAEPDGTPSCIVGVVVSLFDGNINAGQSFHAIVGFGYSNFGPVRPVLIDEVRMPDGNFIGPVRLNPVPHYASPHLKDFNVTASPAAALVLYAAQRVQDDVVVHRTWGEALEAATDVHKQLMARGDNDGVTS